MFPVTQHKIKLKIHQIKKNYSKRIISTVKLSTDFHNESRDFFVSENLIDTRKFRRKAWSYVICGKASGRGIKVVRYIELRVRSHHGRKECQIVLNLKRYSAYPQRESCGNIFYTFYTNKLYDVFKKINAATKNRKINVYKKIFSFFEMFYIISPFLAVFIT